MLDSLYPKYYLDIPDDDDYGGGGDTYEDMGSDYEVPQDVTDMSDAIPLNQPGKVEIKKPKLPPVTPPETPPVTPPVTSSVVIGGTTATTVTYTPEGTPIVSAIPKYKIIEPGGTYTISLIKGDFNPLDTNGETREYTIIGDVGSKSTLVVSNSDGCDLFNESLEITEPSGYIASVVFPSVYEYTTHTFTLRAEPQTILGGGLPKIEYVKEISQYINPTITLSFTTEDPYTTNCAYSGDDVTFTAKSLVEPITYHNLNDDTYGKLTHTVAATITTGYLYAIKAPYISDYLLLDDRTPLSTADLDKTLELGDDETRKSGTIAVTESASKKVITLTSTVQIDKVGKEDTVYELDIDSIITNLPQAFEQEVSTAKETAITIDVLKGINIATYLTPAIVLSPKHGTLSTSFSAGVGTCTYTPPTLFQGKDEFTFEVADGTNTSEDKYTVSINVGSTVCS